MVKILQTVRKKRTKEHYLNNFVYKSSILETGTT